ncbi:MAG: competence protein ComEC [Candidatus Peregrinibacteria bacterium Greene0416_19]|nr:MAG: competence protein ComEC [Candidatus Peregrinibacteria bacterium Greene0416_19]
MARSVLAYVFLGSFAVTAFVLQWWQRSSYPAWLWTLLGFLGLVGLLGILINRRKVGSILVASTLGPALALLTVSRACRELPANAIRHLADGHTWMIEGTVTGEPDRRPAFTQYVVETHEALNGSGQSLPVTGEILVRDSKGWPRFQYGDDLRITGTLRAPDPILDRPQFHFLRRNHLQATLTKTSIERTGSGRGLALFGTMYGIKDAFEDRINRLLPEPHASLLAGLLTGSRRGIPRELNDAFAATGLTHIIAISGYNITLVLSVIGSLLFWLPLKWRFPPLLVATMLFTLFVGASASVVRAAVMGILGLLALQTGRLQTMRLSLLWALFLMTIWNPLLLWWDAGFQLSFLAVAGLIEISPLFMRVVSALPDTLGMRENVRSTLAVEVTTLPWIVHLFGRMSLVAPVANLLVAPVLPAAMLTGFLAVCASAVSGPLGIVIAAFAWVFLEWIIRVATTLSGIPYASVIVQTGVTVVAGYYLLLCIVMVTIHRQAPADARPTPPVSPRSAPAGAGGSGSRGR